MLGNILLVKRYGKKALNFSVPKEADPTSKFYRTDQYIRYKDENIFNPNNLFSVNKYQAGKKQADGNTVGESEKFEVSAENDNGKKHTR